MARRLLATMFTTTTYGSWLPGDVRGYVDDGRVLPHDPALCLNAARRMNGSSVLLSPADQNAALAGATKACDEYAYRMFAISIEAWHMHLLIDHRLDAPDAAIARLKTRMRQAVTAHRGPTPVGRFWSAGYDARYCFTEQAMHARQAYIDGHPGSRRLPP